MVQVIAIGLEAYNTHLDTCLQCNIKKMCVVGKQLAQNITIPYIDPKGEWGTEEWLELAFVTHVRLGILEYAADIALLITRGSPERKAVAAMIVKDTFYTTLGTKKPTQG